MKQPVQAWTQHFTAALQQNRLGHAYLLLGPSISERDPTAREIAQLLLCKKPMELPCGNCEACHWVLADSHPDFLFVDAKTSGKKSLGVEEVRTQIVKKLQQKPQEGSRLVLLVWHADSLTWNAQDALLKTLEEPPPGVVLLFTAENTYGLLETFVSRCQQLTWSGASNESYLWEEWGPILHEFFPTIDRFNLHALLDRVFAQATELTSRRERAQEFLQSFLYILRCTARWRLGVKTDAKQIENVMLTKITDFSRRLSSKKLESLMEANLQALQDLDASITPELIVENFVFLLANKEFHLKQYS